MSVGLIVVVLGGLIAGAWAGGAVLVLAPVLACAVIIGLAPVLACAVIIGLGTALGAV